MSTNASLAGKCGVVTGASRGIGRAVARRLADEGAQLVITSSLRAPDELEAVASDLRSSSGVDVVALAGPIESFDFGGELIDRCVQRHGRIDFLVNVAGIPSGPSSSILDVSHEHWQRLVGIHLGGTFNTCRHAAPLMAARSAGAIVNTSSDAFTGRFLGSGYAAGKGGTNSLTYAIANDLRPHNVRCNAICPSALTDMARPEDIAPRMNELFRRGLISQRILEASRNVPGPEYVATLYAYLVSDLAEDITGAVFRAEGNTVSRYPTPEFDDLIVEPTDRGPWSLEELHERFKKLG
jgi:NAD(P)-dependent dehydrogenase (short-subunit alcohol dehydrogenase family)